jgi:hypothetical protein
MKNAVSGDVTSSGFRNYQRFGETYHLIIMVKRISELGTELSVIFLVTSNVIPSSLILYTLMMEAIRSSETSVLTRTTRRRISEDDTLRCETSPQTCRYRY